MSISFWNFRRKESVSYPAFYYDIKKASSIKEEIEAAEDGDGLSLVRISSNNYHLEASLKMFPSLQPLDEPSGGDVAIGIKALGHHTRGAQSYKISTNQDVLQPMSNTWLAGLTGSINWPKNKERY